VDFARQCWRVWSKHEHSHAMKTPPNIEGRIPLYAEYRNGSARQSGNPEIGQSGNLKYTHLVKL